MKRIVKQLLLYYLVFVLVKSIIAYIIPAPSAFSDEYIYVKLARSFFFNFDFTVHNIVSPVSNPLYFIAISPAYLFNQMSVIYPVMKFINSIISSLVIFPSFLLAKEFFTSKGALKISVLISLLPSNFILSSYILTENLFYPLFLFSIYFIYKSLTSERKIWPISAGIFVGLTYLSRIVGIILFATLIILFLFKLLRREKTFLINIIIIFFISFLIISPWFIINYLAQNNSLNNHISEASTIFELYKFLFEYLIQFILYLGILIISAGIFFPMIISKKIFSKKILTFSILAISSILFILIIAANHNITAGPDAPIDLPAKYIPWLTGRLIGRYIDAVLPLVFLLGFICIKEEIKLKKTILYSSILFFSSQSVLSQLFPINHVSATHIGVFNYLLLYLVKFPTNILITATILAIIPFIFYKAKLTFKKVFLIFTIFLILLNLLNFTLIYYNSDKFWYKGDQMQLGIWMDSYDPKISTILFDKRDCTKDLRKLDQTTLCQPSGSTTIIGFWLNDNIIISEPNNIKNIDFIISRHDLDLPLVKSSEDNIYIYSTEEKRL